MFLVALARRHLRDNALRYIRYCSVFCTFRNKLSGRPLGTRPKLLDKVVSGAILRLIILIPSTSPAFTFPLPHAFALAMHNSYYCFK